MARQRNRKAEEERRNARARELGFRNRAHMRREMERGNFVPARAGRKIVGRAQGPAYPTFAKAGFVSEADYRKARRDAKKWSDAHSRQPLSAYSTRYSDKQFRAYYDAFVNPETRANRIENGLDSLRHWLVDEMGFYAPDEFDDKYTGEL